MDATQHDRGWDLSIAKGTVSVELVNQGPKDLVVHKGEKAKQAEAKPKPEPKPKPEKEAFQFPTPTD